MVKVANAAIIAGDKLPKDYASNFVPKYLSTLVESTSEIYIERETGAIYGASEQDLAALTAENTTFTANDDASDVAFAIDNGKVADLSFFNNYEDGKEYYITAYTGYNVYRIKYVLATKFIDESSDLQVFVLTSETAPLGNNGYYVLTKDITEPYTLSDHVMNGGSGMYPTAKDKGFNGTFDGLGHTISNITFGNCGLFGVVRGAIIRNVAFVNNTIAGYYSAILGQSIGAWEDETGYDHHSYLDNIYVAGTKVTYGAGNIHGNSNKNVGILTQSSTNAYISNVIVNHTMSEKEKETVLGRKQHGVIATTFNYANENNSTKKYSNVYVVGDVPFALQMELGDNTQRNNFVFAGNLLKLKDNSETEYELIEPNKFAFLHTALNATYGDGYKWSHTIAESNTVAWKIDYITTVKQYVNLADMAKDAEANAESLKTFDEKYWTVINNVPYWKTLYNDSLQVWATDSEGNKIDSVIELRDTTTKITLNFTDGSGYVYPSTISVPDGLTLDGNVINLTNNPTTKGSYEVVLTAIIDGQTFERTITIGYTSSETIIDAKMYYSAFDKAIDLEVLNKELDKIDQAPIKAEDISGYYVGDSTEKLDELNLAVVISGTQANFNRTVDTFNKVTLDVAGSVYVLNNVYAYTRVINEVEDLAWFSHVVDASLKAVEGEGIFTGYYIMTKNLDGSNYQGTGEDYQIPGYLGPKETASPKGGGQGLKGVFDGNGYTISNVCVPSFGMFSTTYGGTIQNVAFKNITANGYYECVIAQQTAGSAGVYSLLRNVYIEGTKFKYVYDKGVAIICQNNLMAKMQNVVVVHTPDPETLKLEHSYGLAGSRYGVMVNDKKHGHATTYTNGYSDVYFIGDMPIYSAKANNARGKVMIASNLITPKQGDNFTPIAEGLFTTESHKVGGVSTSYDCPHCGGYTEQELTDAGKKFTYYVELWKQSWFTRQTDDTYKLCPNSKGELVNKTYFDTLYNRIDFVSTIKQYVTVSDMANDYVEVEGEKVYNNATSLSKFDTNYWTLVDGVPTWKTLNA